MIGPLENPSSPDLPISLKGNSKRISGNSLSPLGDQNKDLGADLQTLLTGIRFRHDEGYLIEAAGSLRAALLGALGSFSVFRA